jgi:rubrerythrin
MRVIADSNAKILTYIVLIDLEKCHKSACLSDCGNNLKPGIKVRSQRDKILKKEWFTMSYTHPYGQPQGAAHQFTNKLREILIAEIIAINGYQSHIENSNMEEVNKVWHSIMDDEKKHYGLILKLLRKYDPAEYKEYLAHKVEPTGSKDPMQRYITDFSSQIILNNIRDDIKGELEAVILYEEDLSKFPYRDFRTVLLSIINEEKGHAEHLIALMLKYDPDTYDSLG